jgi:GH24 family phage-related lysozyme (muramidase)
MHVSDAGLRLIEQFEGFSSRPYWDPYGRVWTRGYGETEGITGRSPAIGQQQAQQHLRQLIEQRYEWALRDLHAELNQNQWDALCSFAWNLGAGIFTGGLRAALQGHRWVEAAVAMQAYDHAGGQVLEGLKRRRQLEAQLFLRGPASYMPPDEARWEHEYDQLAHRRGIPASIRRRVLRRVMTRRRKLIWTLAQHTGWQQLDRAARYRQLLTRTEP